MREDSCVPIYVFVCQGTTETFFKMETLKIYPTISDWIGTCICAYVCLCVCKHVYACVRHLSV